MTNIE